MCVLRVSLVRKSVFVSVSGPHLPCSALPLLPHPPTDGFTSEGEYLEITGITREQAGEYKCITDNGIASPDSRTVLVTVNCE